MTYVARTEVNERVRKADHRSHTAECDHRTRRLWSRFSSASAMVLALTIFMLLLRGLFRHVCEAMIVTIAWSADRGGSSRTACGAAVVPPTPLRTAHFLTHGPQNWCVAAASATDTSTIDNPSMVALNSRRAGVAR